MLTVQKLINNKRRFNKYQRCVFARFYCKGEPLDEDQAAYEKYIQNVIHRRIAGFDYEPFVKKPADRQIKGVKKPFVKNLFQGEFDIDLLTYPQVLEGKDLNSLENNFELISQFVRENINPAEIDITTSIPDSACKAIKKLFLFGQMLPSQYKGLNFIATEYAKIMEALTNDLSLPLIQYTHEILCSKSILKYGNEEQKKKYLPKLATGEWLSTFCLGELETGLDDVFAIKTVAENIGNEWLLNGTKRWVINGDRADFYLVVARTVIPSKEQLSAKDVAKNNNYFYSNEALYDVKEGMSEQFNKYYSNNITVFMVEKHFNGISFEKEDTVGARGLNLCTINFENTKIPHENVLGEVNSVGHEIVFKNPANERYVFGSMAASVIKSLLSDATKFSIKTSLGFIKLHERGITQTRLARMNAYLYAIESMTYMTCGLIDLYDDYDASVESAIVKVFSSEAAWYCVNECLNMYGPKGYSKMFPYERYLRDVKALSIFDMNNDLLRLYIATSGLQHIADKKSVDIKKERNPLFYPNHAVKMFFKTIKQSEDLFSLKLKLDRFVHPSLKELTKMLEYSVLRFEYAIHMTLTRHGPQIVFKEMPLKRIANCAISLYAMTAVISRASRAYCIGLKNADFDMQVAETFVKDENAKLKEDFLNLLAGEYIQTDAFYETLSDRSVKSFGYCLEHPTKDNF